MKRIRMPLIILAAVIGLASLPVTRVAAVATQEPTTPSRCSVAEARIENTLGRMEALGKLRIERFQKLHSRLTERTSQLQAVGYDTGRLEATLAIIKIDLDAYASQTQALSDQLKATQDAACGDNDAAFKAALQRARSTLQTTRAAAKKVHTDYQSSIVPELRPLPPG